MPGAFIPVAEESGLIVPIGRWVLEEACRRAASWQAQGHELSMAVNVSGRQFDNNYDLPGDVRAALADNALDPRLLILEMTETTLMRDAIGSARQVHALKVLGLRVAIDDFGTGHSILSRLQQLSVDTLKIDRSLISAIASNPEADALVRAFVQMGKTLGLETYAKGIEDLSQLRNLQNAQCDSGIGYLFARPLSVAAFEALITGAA
jgi:EAL domain-containing protein (putative c-di-GMP-specific phosphodiesterase class I)